MTAPTGPNAHLTARLRKSPAARAVAAAVLAVAVFAQALLPSGWMPTAAALGGQTVLSICAGPVTGLDNAGGAPVNDDPRPAQACPFAGVIALAGPTLPAVTLAAPDLPPDAPIMALDIAAVPRAGAGLPTAPRGPPAYV